MILPQLEQTAIWSTLNMSLPIESPSNVTCQTNIPTLLCPANEILYPAWPAEVRDANGNPTRLICKISFAPYVGMMGPSDAGPIWDGLFFRNSRVRFSDIIDGTSQTLAVGECACSRRSDLGWRRTGASLFPDPDEGEISLPNPKPSSGMILGYAGAAGPGSPNSEIDQFYSLHGGREFPFRGRPRRIPTHLARRRGLPGPGDPCRGRAGQPARQLSPAVRGLDLRFPILLQEVARVTT